MSLDVKSAGFCVRFYLFLFLINYSFIYLRAAGPRACPASATSCHRLRDGNLGTCLPHGEFRRTDWHAPGGVAHRATPAGGPSST